MNHQLYSHLALANSCSYNKKNVTVKKTRKAPRRELEDFNMQNHPAKKAKVAADTQQIKADNICGDKVVSSIAVPSGSKKRSNSSPSSSPKELFLSMVNGVLHFFD